MSDLIERLRASENQIAQPGYLSLATRARIEEELHQAAAELARLRSQPTSDGVRTVLNELRLACPPAGFKDHAADLIESLARSEAAHKDKAAILERELAQVRLEWTGMKSETELCHRKLAAHKADAERLTKRQAGIIGAFTGITCGPFSDVHEYVNSLPGFSGISTISFASEEVAAEIKEAARADFLAICRPMRAESP